MALLTVGPTFDQGKNKINKISLKILRIRNSEIWLFDDVSKIINRKRNMLVLITIFEVPSPFSMLLSPKVPCFLRRPQNLMKYPP